MERLCNQGISFRWSKPYGTSELLNINLALARVVGVDGLLSDATSYKGKSKDGKMGPIGIG